MISICGFIYNFFIVVKSFTEVSLVFRKVFTECETLILCIACVRLLYDTLSAIHYVQTCGQTCGVGTMSDELSLHVEYALRRLALRLVIAEINDIAEVGAHAIRHAVNVETGLGGFAIDRLEPATEAAQTAHLFVRMIESAVVEEVAAFQIIASLYDLPVGESIFAVVGGVLVLILISGAECSRKCSVRLHSAVAADTVHLLCSPRITVNVVQVVCIVFLGSQRDIRNFKVVARDNYLMRLGSRTRLCEQCPVAGRKACGHVLVREDNIRRISLKHLVGYLVVVQVYRLELNLVTCQIRQFCKSGIGAESLSELVTTEVHGQNERVPLVGLECLLQVQHLVPVVV